MEQIQAKKIDPSQKEEIDAVQLRMDNILSTIPSLTKFFEVLNISVEIYSPEEEEKLRSTLEAKPHVRHYLRASEPEDILGTFWPEIVFLTRLAESLSTNGTIGRQAVVELLSTGFAWQLLGRKYEAHWFQDGKALISTGNNFIQDDESPELVSSYRTQKNSVEKTIGTDLETFSWSSSMIPQSDVDPLLPPLAALEIVGDMIRDCVGISKSRDGNPSLNVICIGMGIDNSAQTLSVMSPGVMFADLSVPYRPLSNDAAPLEDIPWDMIVLGVPNYRQWSAVKSANIPAGEDDPHSIPYDCWPLRRRMVVNEKNTDHVEELLDLAIRHRKTGQALALVADPAVHDAVVNILEKRDLAYSVPPYAFDIPGEGFLVEYQEG